MAKKKTKKKVKKAKFKKPVKVEFNTKPKKPAEPPPAKPEVKPYPTAGAKVQEFEDILDKHLAGDVTPTPKRGPGRPPKEKTQEPEQPELTIDVVAGVIKIPFELWAIGQDVWQLKLNDKEAAQIAEPAKQLLEYYLPKIPVIAYAWISLSVSTFWVMQSRLRTIKKIREQRQKQQPPRPAEPAPPGVETKFPTEMKPEKV